MSVCQYCDKEFKSERTLAAHMCVRKKRVLEKDTIGCNLGLRVFQRFYELTTRSKKPKTLDDFIRSRYYLAFVKFARHMADLNPIEPSMFVDYIISNGFDMNEWCSDKVYHLYLKKLVEEEHIDRALERSLYFMDEWCKENKCELNEFFNTVSTFEAVTVLQSARVSPWLLFVTDSGIQLLNRMSNEQISMIESIIDQSTWANKVRNNKDDVKTLRAILKEFNL